MKNFLFSPKRFICISISFIMFWATGNEFYQTTAQAINHDSSLGQYNYYVNLMEYFKSISNSPAAIGDDFNRPDDYSGACYDVNSDGKITLYLTSTDHINIYKEYIPDAHVEIVSYNYNYLRSLVDFLSPYSIRFDISSIRLNERDNCVYIATSCSDKVKSFLVSEGYDTNAVVFEPKSNTASAKIENDNLTDKQPNNTDVIKYAYSGQKIYTEDGQYGSIGFHAYKSQTGQYGIVTCAHVIENCYYCTNQNSDIINYVSNCSQVHAQYVDAAFVPFQGADWQIGSAFYSNTSYQGHIAGTAAYILQNDPVSRYGGTTGCKSGVILNTYCSTTYNSITLNGLIYSSATCLGGDSGGPLGSYQSSYLYVMGITCAHDTYTNYTYACRASYIYSALGVAIVCN